MGPITFRILPSAAGLYRGLTQRCLGESTSNPRTARGRVRAGPMIEALEEERVCIASQRRRRLIDPVDSFLEWLELRGKLWTLYRQMRLTCYECMMHESRAKGGVPV